MASPIGYARHVRERWKAQVEHDARGARARRHLRVLKSCFEGGGRRPVHDRA